MNSGRCLTCLTLEISKGGLGWVLFGLGIKRNGWAWLCLLLDWIFRYLKVRLVLWFKNTRTIFVIYAKLRDLFCVLPKVLTRDQTCHN